jgi:hypothetical protein
MGHFAMELMRLSDDELINEFERKLLMKCSLDGVVLKGAYNSQIELIKNEIKRRMK